MAPLTLAQPASCAHTLLALQAGRLPPSLAWPPARSHCPPHPPCAPTTPAGYARADRKTQGRESIAAKLTANLITQSGADRVLTMDLHSGQCVGYFDIPVDHVYGEGVILDYLASKRIPTGDLVVVSPDVGGVARWVALGAGA